MGGHLVVTGKRDWLGQALKGGIEKTAGDTEGGMGETEKREFVGWIQPK